jgi:signal transduction histidine kinase
MPSYHINNKLPFKILLFYILACSVFYGNAQKIDVLEDSLRINKLTDEQKIKIHNVLAREYSFVDAVKAISNAEMALKLSQDLNYSTGIANAYRIIGSVYAQNENYYQSLELFLASLDIFKRRNDSLGIANVYTSLGHYYRRLQKGEKAFSYYKDALEIFRGIGNEERLGVAIHNLSESYLHAKDYQKSRQLALESIIINKKIENLPVLSACYNVMGQLEMEIGAIDAAINYFKDVLEISNLLGDNSQKVATVNALINLSKIYLEKQDYKKMLLYFDRAIAFCKSSLLSDKLTEIYMLMIDYYNDANQPDSVEYYLTEYQVLMEERKAQLNKDRYQLINSAESSFYLKKENKELEEFSSVQDSKIQMAYLIIIFISILIIILVWSLLTNIKKNKLLAKQQKTIESQKKHLEELNFTKDKFFSIVAHDMKSPLNSMKSFSDLMLDHLEDLTREDMIDMNLKINNSLNNTLKMADNLLNWARIQMQDVNIQRSKINVEEVLKPIISLYLGISSKKDIQFSSKLDENLFIYADPDQLTFIVRNLISNAIKFTKKQGNINIISYSEENKVIIRIEDDGVGMPKKIKENVFNLENKYSMKGTDGESGTGLGLMLCLEFLKMNDGEIEIESEKDKGTIVTLTFELDS